MRATSTLAAGVVAFALGCHAPPEDPCDAPLGTVRGVVVNALDEAPVAHVRVRSRRCPAETRTGADGRFELRVPAGDARLWLDGRGYVEGQRANVTVRAGAVTEIDAKLFPAAPTDAAIAAYFARQPARRHAHPAHDLPSVVDDDDDVGAVRAPIGEGTLPETIRVWRAGGTALEPSASNGYADSSCHADAVVEEYPLEEYVKGVIPHEWFPSWHPEALRAGAIAARTYAVNWWRRGGRWSCADVDDGTVTQVYDDDRAGPTNEAVDATAGQVVMRDGAVFSTEYSAENGDPTEFAVAEPTCTGTSRFGHGRGMCQWGTHRWASEICANPPCDWSAFGMEPRDHVWMVEHYYPGASVASCGEPAAPCGVIPEEGGVVDDAGACFTAYGPSMYWRTETEGWEGGLHWTNAFEADAPSNWARWRLHFERAGTYRVEAFITDAYAVYPEARYGVQHAGGEAAVIVDQGTADGWIDLGEFDFDAEGAVMLYDDYTGAVPADQRIVADAIRLTPIGAVGGGPVPGVDAGSVTPLPRVIGAAAREVRRGGLEGGCAVGAPREAAPLGLVACAALALLRRRRRS